jgi:lincosamide and streptogramin A transport system ATP-binding/permease protein
MSKINVSGLTFGYDGSAGDIFHNASFVIDTDWKLGFIGRNGRGKTTFLRLLMGMYPYAGSIDRSVACDYYPFEVPDPSLTVRQVAQAVPGGEEPWRFEREARLLNLDGELLDRSFGTLSGGEQTRALLAMLFAGDGRFLLIDEPTNHLDMEGREAVSAYLNTKKGFILVSHDRTFLDGCIDHVLSINRSTIDVMKGNFSTWQQYRLRQDTYELDENERIKKEIVRLHAAARRAGAWADSAEKTKYAAANGGTKPADRGYIGAKAAKGMKRAKAVADRAANAAEEKGKLLKNLEMQDALALRPLAHHAGTLVSLRDAAVRYDGRTVFSGINLAVAPGDRVAVCGRNGSGKTSLLKLIAGELLPAQGDAIRASGLVISAIPQDTSHVSGDIRDFIAEKNMDETLFLTILRKLDLSRDMFEKDLSSYSAGQKKKLLIARSLCEQAHLYLWDEPLNYIDVISRMQIENLLLKYAPTILFVEHDRAFTDRIATKKLVLA